MRKVLSGVADTQGERLSHAILDSWPPVALIPLPEHRNFSSLIVGVLR